MTEHRCPDDELIAAYFDGLLTPNQEAALQREMVRCPDCVGLLASIGVVVRDTAAIPDSFSVPRAVTDSAKALMTPAAPVTDLVTLAVRWLDDALQPLVDAIQPTLTPGLLTRGAAEKLERYEELKFHVSLGDLSLEIDLEVDGPNEVALTARPTKTPPSGVLLRLTSDGVTRAVSSLSPFGSTVSALTPGSYELILEQGGRPLGRMAIELHP